MYINTYLIYFKYAFTIYLVYIGYYERKVRKNGKMKEGIMENGSLFFKVRSDFIDAKSLSCYLYQGWILTTEEVKNL